MSWFRGVRVSCTTSSLTEGVPYTEITRCRTVGSLSRLHRNDAQTNGDGNFG